MAENLTPSALLKHVRSTVGEDGLRNLPPLALQIGLAEGHSLQDPDWMYTQSMTVSPTVHPILAALMDHHGATRRGRATWQIGYGEDTNQTAMGVLLDSAREGTVWWKQDLTSRDKPKDLSSNRTRPNHSAWERARLQGPLRGYMTPARAEHFHYLNRYQYDPASQVGVQLGAGRYGIIALKDTARSMFISVHTTQFLDIPESLADEIGYVPLNIWQVGRGFKDPVKVYPAQAAAIAEWAGSRGLAIVDTDGSAALTKFRSTASRSVIAWPRRGRPAQTTVSVGTRLPHAIRKALGTGRAPEGRAATLANTDSVKLASALGALPEAQKAVHPAVLDTAAMAAAQPVSDARLRDYQCVAVGRHLATNIGYVNASSPGLGKTIMVLDAMSRRSSKIPGYRGLVVAEANVRSQWCSEAAKWFPAATTVRVESRSDAAELAQVLAEAGPFPVLVITSYNLASDVTAMLPEESAPATAGFEPEVDDEDDEAKEPELPDASEGELAAPTRNAAPTEEVPKNSTPLTVPAQGDEPADLLEMLALILATDVEDAEAGETEGDTRRVALGEVLLSQFWHDIIADEAVTLRSTGSRQSKALWMLREQSQVAVALTGTPVNKGINDLGHLVSWVRGDRKLFHGASLESQFDLSDDEQLADFAESLGAILFRRDKSEITDELPDVDSTVMALEPTAAERALANAARNELKRAYDELVSWLEAVAAEHSDSEEFAAAKAALAEARYAWLGGTTLARMASSDPAAMLTAKGSGAALLASQGLVAAATATPGTKRTAVVTDVIDRVANGERVLIFTEFATIAKGLIQDLDASGVRVGEVVGGGGSKRDRHVLAFRDGELDVLVCTTAGERGLNLQTATTIVHYDLPWTPDGIIQRMGRVERIGATAAKLKVVFPVMAGTIEERVASVVVARAATMMRALDSARGVDVRCSDVGRALGSLAATARDDEVSAKDSALLSITRELLAA